MLSRERPSSARWKHTTGTSAERPRLSASRGLRSTAGWKSMVFDRSEAGMTLRVTALLLTIAGAAWMIANTTWYVTIALCTGAALAETALLIRYITRSSREVARFLDALA